MSHTIDVEGTPNAQSHSSNVLDETVWRAWLKKTLLEERRRATARIKAVKLPCIVVLMATAVASSYVSTPYVSVYQAVVRVAIGLGAIVILFESIRLRQYTFTALFAGIVLLFNPLFPVFALSGNRLIVLASVLPFVASLVWMKQQTRARTVQQIRPLAPASAGPASRD